MPSQYGPFIEMLLQKMMGGSPGPGPSPNHPLTQEAGPLGMSERTHGTREMLRSAQAEGVKPPLPADVQGAEHSQLGALIAILSLLSEPDQHLRRVMNREYHGQATGERNSGAFRGGM